MGLLSNIFGPSNTNTAVNPTPPTNPNSNTNPNAQVQPGNLPNDAATKLQSQQTQNTAPNGVIPEQDTKDLNSTNTSTSEQPLSEFKDLWKEPVKEGETPTDNSIFGTVDNAALLKVAQGIDFTKEVVTPEVLQAIQNGGEQGTAALLDTINKVQQLTYAKSAAVTAQIVEKAIATAESRFVSKLPSHVKSAQVNDLISKNPMYSNPSTRPIVDMVVSQLQTKYPNASTHEIDQIAGKYFQQFGSVLGTTGNSNTTEVNTGGRSTFDNIGKVQKQPDQDFSFMLDEPQRNVG